MTLLVAVAAAWLLVALAPAFVRLTGRHAGWPLAAGMLAVLGLVISAWNPQQVVRESLPWIPALDVALRLRLNGLALLFAVVVLAIGAVVLVYSSSYLRQPRSPGFYGLMTAFAAAMLTLVLADDLVVLFVAWELTTLCSYLLILRSGPAAKEPATRTLLVTAAGGLALLAAVVTLIARTGTTELTAALAHPLWREDPGFATVVAVLVALAAMTKSAQFPFHSWLPDAMVAPAPVSAYLHAAAMVKAGIFLLMLFAPAASAAAIWSPLLVGVGLWTALMGAFFAVRRADMKELLAYSTVSQLGLLVAVIGVGTPTAMLAASAHVVAHALFKSAGFMGVGLVEKRTGTRILTELRGSWGMLRWDAAMLILAAVSMAGIPPMLGFISKELLLDSFLTAASPALSWTLAIVATAGAVLTVAYSLRLVLPLLPGRLGAAQPGEHGPQARAWRDTRTMSVAVSVPAILGLALGAGAPLLDPLVRPAAAGAARVDAVSVSGIYLWHGVNAALLLSVTAIVLGTLVGLRLRGTPVPPTPQRWSGVLAVQYAQRGIIALGRRVGDLTRSDAPAANLVVPIVLIGAAAAALPAMWRGWPRYDEPFLVLDLLLLLLVAAGVIAVSVATRRLTAIISVGVAGFAVVLWFLVLGASDVAVTQLLVEILTVVVMVLVLRRMPRRLRPSRPRRRVLAVIAALAAGATATLAALVFTGHREISDVAAFFLREAKELTGGTNIVNTILVDFRALDTLGELVVLGIAAVSITALLEARRAVDRPVREGTSAALSNARANAVFLTTVGRIVAPVMVVGSAYALLRGHNDPGGGFIAALIGAAAIALIYLAAPSDEIPRIERSYLAIAGAGVVIAVGTGLLGLLDGSFLRPLHFDIGSLHLTTALVFDLGVYLAVFGVILAAINRLGLSPAEAVRTDRSSERSVR
ncbi:hydrogen gas-evolving membrane-bound hydrogenase subunit E [Microbacterium sp. NPDC006705]|uniref:hydrogen gas-evolving membrane-bound hydrogenase subunit E n=1 Tax=unclassified Microbacterium TaxID=2609290 RepID=UPI00249EE454|nr:hydrogen gas-evolving membrane-bound hydrogenase subunit E [Microbacterium sp. BDGP8]WHE35970.1 proton-conducting transporter membrane subunit [Microbacterium sp. BDGP8]